MIQKRKVEKNSGLAPNAVVGKKSLRKIELNNDLKSHKVMKYKLFFLSVCMFFIVFEKQVANIGNKLFALSL
jgi:hypothetical protein